MSLMNFIKRGTEEISDRLAAAPGARPDLLFSTPETVGFTHQGVQVDVENFWNTILSEWTIAQATFYIPVDADEGLELYGKLLDLLKKDEV